MTHPNEDPNYFKIKSQDEATALKNLVPDYSSYGLTSLPESLLTAHEARMLNPSTAARVDGYIATQPTAYRFAELLVPLDAPLASIGEVLVTDLGVVINRVGTTMRCKLVEDTDADRRKERLARGKPAVVDIDAWRALQTLRAATLEGDGRLTKTNVERISLNRLLIGSAMGGIGGVSVLHGVPGAIGGNPDPGRDVADLGYWRSPVALQMPPAQRTEVPRRPVIAVLDTGVGQSRWLGIESEDRLGSFVTVDTDIQKKVHSPVSQNSVAAYWDHPSIAAPLVGTMSSHAGHGTFIIGVIHQVEPDADVLAIRLMHNDGIVYSDVLIDVLEELLTRVTTAQDSGNTANMVDVVSLSLGGYREEGARGAEYDLIKEKIDALRARGVVVVASAGNYASARHFWPAALASRDVSGDPPVISVGARNPNGTKALFTNDALWVTTWALGAALVSTFPENYNGSAQPRFEVKADDAVGQLGVRASLEVDDFVSGYAIWAGTSFAAPAVAAKIAQLLKGNNMSDVSPAATLNRARAAVRTIFQM